MGILLVCKNVNYSCSYGRWMEFREWVGDLAIQVLRKKRESLPQTEEDFLYRETTRLLEYCEIENVGTQADYLRVLYNTDFLNLYIFYHLGGIYALLNKSDDDGYYSVGNAVDIVRSFEVLDALIDEDDMKRQLYSIKEVFEESVRTNENVIVC